MDPNIYHLAELIRSKNEIEAEIASQVGRPALIGHVGEWIASIIFDIQLEPTATQKGYDGLFRNSPLAGQTVNVKWYGKQEGILDLTPGALPDLYLVMTGPISEAGSSKEKTRPWLIEHVFLFESQELVRQLSTRKVKIGIATSIPKKWWEAAEIYPQNNNKLLRLISLQMEMLALFGHQTHINP